LADLPARTNLHQASWPLVRRLVRGYVRPELGRIAVALGCMALAALATAGLAKLMEPILDSVFIARDREMVSYVAVAVLATFAIKGLATYGQAVIMTAVGQRIVAALQNEMFAHLMRADLAFFHESSTGRLVSRFTNDVNLLRGAVSTALAGIGKDTLTVVFLAGVMFHQDWLLALVASVVFPLAVFPIVRIGRRMRKVSFATQNQLGTLTALLAESFQGVRHVKAYGMEEYEKSRAARSVAEVYRLACKAARTRSLSHPIMETLGGIAILLVLLYGGTQVIGGERTTGQLFSFISALLLAYEPMKRLAQLNANLQEGLAAAARVFEMLDLEPAIVDRPGAKPLAVSRGAIRFDSVRFSYGASDDGAALDGVTLDIPGGKRVALVGPSGAGKSTVLNLIPRFYDADGGRVLIDGQDVRDVTMASLRSRIALVSQEIALFDDTIRANIAYGRPDATEDSVIAAARSASAHDFVMELAEGYDTRVGGAGVKLSGGQRQRIAIARAMLKDAPILLLDEATSALDTESERQVQEALRTLMRGRTTVVIAHRLSTIVDADLIYVLDRGQAIESGSHAELLARGGAYARLYALQFAEELDEAAEEPAGAPAAARA
jgi:subfamily B ATP-binding cassette protein MsbA